MMPVAAEPPMEPPTQVLEYVMAYEAPKGSGAAAIDADIEAATDDTPNGLNNLRGTALIEAAMAVGTQAGLNARYTVINGLLTQRAAYLNQTFRFGPLALGDGRVLPPVITEAGNAIRVNKAGTSASSSSKTWHIQAPARIVNAMPDWRDYLVRHFKPVNMARDVPPLLLPENKDERKTWRASVKRGWHDGIRQADAIFSRQLHALVRDIKGMMRFHQLKDQNIVKAPRLSEGRAGVTLTDDGRTLRVDDRVLRLSDAQFERRSKKWRLIPLSKK